MLDDDEISPILLDGLATAAGKGNALAHYALALIHDPGEDDDEGEVGSPYWYSQAQQVRALAGVEKEWADTHARHLVKAEKYARHLREAARLGNDDALLDLAERFDDPSFYERSRDDPSFYEMPCGSIVDPVKVAEIAERLGREKDARHWLRIAAEAGDTEAMRRLIEEYDRDDMQQCWIWFHLAQSVGTDLTKNEYYIINEDGSRYDDDVGGPVFVGGGGVKLEPLDAERDAAARHAAERLFERLQKAKYTQGRRAQ